MMPSVDTPQTPDVCRRDDQAVCSNTTASQVLQILIPRPALAGCVHAIDPVLPQERWVSFATSSQELETLTKFYLLAGRISGNMTMECDDQGILYLEARVNCSMVDFLRAPCVASLGGFLPRNTTCSEPIHEIVQVAIQVTGFVCGGIAIVSPDLITAPRLFPANELLASHSSSSLATEGGNNVLKRFTFDMPAIDILKSRAKSEDIPNSSSVEVVSVFISKHCMLAFNAVNTGDHEGPSSLSHTVNMRSRRIPPLPTGSIGNLCELAAMEFHALDELHALVSRLRQTISGINDGSVKFLQSEKGDQEEEQVHA
ncbi:Stemmadenine O-acetyltransferase-like protein [Drosera capensis]